MRHHPPWGILEHRTKPLLFVRRRFSESDFGVWVFKVRNNMATIQHIGSSAGLYKTIITNTPALFSTDEDIHDAAVRLGQVFGTQVIVGDDKRPGDTHRNIIIRGLFNEQQINDGLSG
jgi:hypothetical protein